MNLEDIKDKMEDIREDGESLRIAGEKETVLSIIQDYNRGLVSLLKHSAAVAIMIGVPVVIIALIITVAIYIGG